MIRNENTPLRAVIYTRISDDPSGLGANAHDQELKCAKLAADNGMTVVSVLTDNDKTAAAENGKRAKRPAYDRMITMLDEGRADAVIVWQVDRLYRSHLDLEPLINLVERTHTAILPVMSAPLDLTTSTGRMVARLLAVVATAEIEKMKERMKLKKESNRAAGANPGGPRPFGFKPVRKTPKGEAPEVQQLDEDEAELIRTAARDVLTGKSLSSICRDWTARGITTPRGNAWQISPLCRLLTSARVAGRIEHDGKIIGDAQWPSIIDYPTWLAMRAVLVDPARRSSDDNKIKWLGSGIYTCHCGNALRIGSSQNGRHQYRCNMPGKGHVTRPAEPLDEYVTSELLDYLTRIAPASETEGMAPEPSVDPETAELEAEVKRQQSRLDALAAAFAGDGDLVEYRTLALGIRDKITELEDQIAQTVVTAYEDMEPDDYGLSAEEAWPQYDIETKRAVLRSRVKVTVLPARRGRPPKDAPVLDTSLIDLEWAPPGRPFKD
ncbi:recombinase family protein [Streptomyces mirabilis]|uniref:recombinase family protein n=1 Tax=Streptomyces mirabilis TaxID=68239 RepID=UPI003318173B